jgi:hypothetical protein
LIRFDRRQLVAFVRALDRNLDRPTTVVVIGGAAAAMAYHAGTKTADIDVWRGLTDSLLEAAGRARRDTGLAVQIGSAAVADFPLNYEDRLRQARGLALEKLTMVFPDKYDLALAKGVRGYQHDLDAIEGIHRNHRLAARTLITRFEEEMTAAITDPRKLRLNMAMVAARLYGFEEGRRLAIRWGVPVPGNG